MPSNQMRMKRSYFSNNYNPTTEESASNSHNFYPNEEDLMTPQHKSKKEEKPTPSSFLKNMQIPNTMEKYKILPI